MSNLASPGGKARQPRLRGGVLKQERRQVMPAMVADPLTASATGYVISSVHHGRCSPGAVSYEDSSVSEE